MDAVARCSGVGRSIRDCISRSFLARIEPSGGMWTHPPSVSPQSNTYVTHRFANGSLPDLNRAIVPVVGTDTCIEAVPLPSAYFKYCASALRLAIPYRH